MENRRYDAEVIGVKYIGAGQSVVELSINGHLPFPLPLAFWDPAKIGADPMEGDRVVAERATPEGTAVEFSVVALCV